MLMLSLDDAAEIAARFAKVGYSKEFLRGELEQKCYIVSSDHLQNIMDCAGDINIDTIAEHIRRGDLACFLSDLRACIISNVLAEHRPAR